VLANTRGRHDEAGRGIVTGGSNSILAPVCMLVGVSKRLKREGMEIMEDMENGKSDNS
jgi:hypothetical protein